VKALQDTLYKLGYMPRQQNTGGYGRFGPQTLQGLLRYQQAHGITNTGGQYGPRTQAALEQSVTQFNAAKGIAQTTAAADKHYVSQWGPTPSNSNKAPYGFADCGPTSGLMALSALGLIEKPSPQNASKVIDSIRDAAVGQNTNYSRLMGFPMLANGLNQFGARTQMIQGGVEGFEAALSRGNPIILGGNPWNAWGREQRAQGNYLANGDGGHFVTVFGKTESGNYIVADPLFVKGTREVTYEQLRQFSAAGYGAMEVMRPQGK
jgi:peptidoglycan hydrolase-like protein with peptidoglycan-binding domain